MRASTAKGQRTGGSDWNPTTPVRQSVAHYQIGSSDPTNTTIPPTGNAEIDGLIALLARIVRRQAGTTAASEERP